MYANNLNYTEPGQSWCFSCKYFSDQRSYGTLNSISFNRNIWTRFRSIETIPYMSIQTNLWPKILIFNFIIKEKREKKIGARQNRQNKSHFPKYCYFISLLNEVVCLFQAGFLVTSIIIFIIVNKNRQNDNNNNSKCLPKYSIYL